jgi:hypothetical protein
MQQIRNEGDVLIQSGGQVLVLGDWNSMPPLVRPEWKYPTCRSSGAKHNWQLLEPVLCRDRSLPWVLANPLDGATVSPTRIDPGTQGASILDLVFFQPDSGAYITDFLTTEVHGKDHWLVEFAFHTAATALVTEVQYAEDGVSPLYVTKCTVELHPRYRLPRTALINTEHSKMQWEQATELFDQPQGRIFLF